MTPAGTDGRVGPSRPYYRREFKRLVYQAIVD
jgi:hypothetical protein